MLKINKPNVMTTTVDKGFRKEIESVQASNRSFQNRNNTGCGYNIFDGPQAENEHMDRPLINPTSCYETKGEEFHWMASAAYNQSK
ncbi:MAG: hypothetical protein Q7U54_05080 [Bacteroidales bacterium]|nr:hypothetical protein [Bacteroidales bacterium]